MLVTNAYDFPGVADLEDVELVANLERATLELSDWQSESGRAGHRIDIDLKAEVGEAASFVLINVVVDCAENGPLGNVVLQIVAGNTPFVRQSPCSALAHSQGMLEDVDEVHELSVLVECRLRLGRLLRWVGRHDWLE